MRYLLVTHHAPDLDAVAGVWMLKRFDHQHYADAKVAFVDPGNRISPEEAERLGFQMHTVTHVDTGGGEFDHHTPEQGHLQICATSLAYDYVCRLHPELKDDAALKEISRYTTEVDHFGEVHWPEANSPRYCFSVHSILQGFEAVDPHNDDSQLHFGMQCLDSAYAALKDHLHAAATLSEGTTIELPFGKVLATTSRNDHVIKYAQKAGFTMVIRKDPQSGEMRIKVRPDSSLDLKALSDKIQSVDHQGTWYYHPSGKMLLNGSRKHRHQRPTSLGVNEVLEFVKELYTEHVEQRREHG